MEMPSLLTLVVSHTGEDSVSVPMHYFESHYTEVGHSNLYLSKGDARLSSSHLQDLESREGFRPAMHALLDVSLRSHGLVQSFSYFILGA